MVAKMSDSILGIDVSKETLDAYCARGQRKQGRTFANSPDGWKLVRAWLKAMGSKQAHVCMEATGRHSLGVALALHEAGHVVSVVNPAQIRDFARTKLGRNKTDKVDAALICEYAELFKPEPWTPPSPAMRRLCELQTMRAGIIRSRAEWKNRIGSGLGDAPRPSWPPRRLTISPANSRRSTGPLARLSSRTPNCAADATCCSASSVSARRWPPR
jgi:transposase